MSLRKDSAGGVKFKQGAKIYGVVVVVVKE